MNKNVISFFTENSIPKSGLSPSIYIYDITGDSLVVNGASMTEKGSSPYIFYLYTFTSYDNTKEYFVLVDGGESLPINERYQPGVNNFVSVGEMEDVVGDVEGGEL